MRRFGLATNRLFLLSLTLFTLAMGALPALAQDQTTVTTETTETTTTWISEYGIWIGIGVVLLIALIIGLSRGRGGSNTTVVK